MRSSRITPLWLSLTHQEGVLCGIAACDHPHACQTLSAAEVTCCMHAMPAGQHDAGSQLGSPRLQWHAHHAARAAGGPVADMHIMPPALLPCSWHVH